MDAVPDTGFPRPASEYLKNATTIGRISEYEVSGFVGAGDGTDTYVLKSLNSTGGLLATIKGIDSASLKVTYYDAQLHERVSVSSDGKDDVELLVGVISGDTGFLQVAAENGSTTYDMTIKAREPFDSPLTADIGRYASATAREGVKYEGFLDSSRRALFLPIRINSARNVQVELTGLTAEASLTMLRQGGDTIPSNHTRPGTEPEFFSEDLAPGLYYVRVQSGGSAQTKFALTYSTKPASVSVALDPDQARADATDLGDVVGYSITRKATLSDQVEYLAFNISKEATFTAELSGFTASSDIDLYLESRSGENLAKSTNVGGLDESISIELSSGHYFLRLQQTGTSSSSKYELDLGAREGLVHLDYEEIFGSLVETKRDFSIYRDGDKCTMVTEATQVSPRLGWREVWPYFYIGVTKGSDSIFISMDHQRDDELYVEKWARANIDGNDRLSLPMKVENGNWMPLVPCRNKSDTCVDTAAINRFKAGYQLELHGVDPGSKDDVAVTYSLLGYIASATRINEICGAKASWLYR